MLLTRTWCAERNGSTKAASKPRGDRGRSPWGRTGCPPERVEDPHSGRPGAEQMGSCPRPETPWSPRLPARPGSCSATLTSCLCFYGSLLREELAPLPNWLILSHSMKQTHLYPRSRRERVRRSRAPTRWQPEGVGGPPVRRRVGSDRARPSPGAPHVR